MPYNAAENIHMSGIAAEDALFVPPCGDSFEANCRFRLYYCPATRDHRESRFLGIYRDKAVRAVGEIVKVVPCAVDTRQRLVTVVDRSGVLTHEEAERILNATSEARSRNWDLTSGHKFFLCDKLYETDFRKESRGGIQGHRRINLQEILGDVPNNAGDLAKLLYAQTWK
jgi:hypothetical protein